MQNFFDRSSVPVFVAAITVAAMPTAGHAQELRATAVGGLERTDSAPGTGAVDGFYYGIQLGADWDLGGVSAGVEAELGDSTAAGLLPGNRALQGVFASAAVRLAVPLNDRLQVFVRGGYTYHEIAYTTGPAFKHGGYTVGGGAEIDLTRGLFLRGEYRFSNYGRSVRGQQFLGGAGVRF